MTAASPDNGKTVRRTPLLVESQPQGFCMAPDLDPNDLNEIAKILARGYLRYRDSLRRQLPNSLASTAEISPPVTVVNKAENDQYAAEATKEERA